MVSQPHCGSFQHHPLSLLCTHRVLEFILRQLHPMEDAPAGERWKKATVADAAGALSKLSSPDFHKGVLSVALEIVAVVVPPVGRRGGGRKTCDLGE